MRAPAAFWAVLLAGGLFCQSAKAHTLDLTTAKLSLRDEHVEVIVELDLLQLFDKTPTELAVLSDDALLSQLDHAKALLQKQTELRTRGARLPVAVTGFPSREDLRMMAATTAGNGSPHGPLVRIRLESAATLRDATELSIALPAALGPVVTTFVQPTTRFLSPGQTTSFAVLTPQAAAPHPVRAAAPWMMTGLALVGLGLVRRSQRIAPQQTRNHPGG